MEDQEKYQEEMKSSKHDLIEKLCKENEIEIMHLQLYLSVKGIVCRNKYEDDEI